MRNLGPLVYAALAPHYDDAVGRPFFGALRRAFDHLVARHGLRFRDALDLGCGTGLFARHLAERYGARVLGVDNAPAMLAVARRTCQDGRVSFLRQDLRELALPCRFDLVTANFDTLNHLRDPDDLQRVLRAIASLMRPGGHLVFDVLTPAAARELGTRHPRWLRLARGRVWQGVRIARSADGASELVTTLRIVRRMQTQQPVAEQAERLYPTAQVGAALRDAGLVLRDLLDARTLQPAMTEPVRALFVARKP